MDDDPDVKTDSTIKASAASTSEKRKMSDTLKKAPQKLDLSRQDLLRLLSYLEGELQARDVVISTIKSETAKQLLYQAKYGRLALNDPLAAFQRDSEVCASSDDFDEAAVGRMYESQLGQLEKLIAVQRRAHHRAKQVLATAERRHMKIVRELEDEKQRRAQDAAQGDDVCMMLEKERERLKQEIEVQKGEKEKVEKDLEKLKQTLHDEKERRKDIVLYLLQERRVLMIRLMEERLKVQSLTGAPSQGPSTSDASAKLKAELDATKASLEKEREECASLREIVRTQEDDLNLIRQTILAKTKRMNQQPPTSATNQHPTHNMNGKPQKMIPAGQPSPASGTVRYHILTRPGAPGGSTSAAESDTHPTMRFLNPAFQAPQLSPQSASAKRAAVLTTSHNLPAVPPPPLYSNSIDHMAAVAPNLHNFSTKTPVAASSSAYATTSVGVGAVLRRPAPPTMSPSKASPSPTFASINGFAKDSKRTTNVATTSMSPSSAASSGVRQTPDSDLLRFGVSTTRVALTQIPSNFNNAGSTSSGGGQRVATTNSDSGGKQRKGGVDSQVSRSGGGGGDKKGDDDLMTVEPEIAHLEAVINSMTSNVDDDANHSPIVAVSSSPSVSTPSGRTSLGLAENLSINVDSSYSPSTGPRRFPVVGGNVTSSSSQSVGFHRPLIATVTTSPGGKRAPTPSPTGNRIPLPLNGVLTKSLSSSSASSPPTYGSTYTNKGAESDPSTTGSGVVGGRFSSTSASVRLAKTVNAIGGKVQKKLAPNPKRNDANVRSTQV